MQKGLLVSEDLIEALSSESNIEEIHSIISSNSSPDLLFLNNEIKSILCRGRGKDMVCAELEKSMVMAEKSRGSERYSAFIGAFEGPPQQQVSESKKEKDEPLQMASPVKVVSSFEEVTKKKEVQDFVSYLNARYSSIEKFLRQRGEMQNVVSISRVLAKREKESLAVIGIVLDKQITKNGNITLVVEDPTGVIKVNINKNKPDLFEKAKDIVLDEVIGIMGFNGDRIIFASGIVWPEIPSKQMKKADDESYAVFLSDIHVGSEKFLKDEFEKFIKWLRQESGSESQKQIASKVKYVFIIGDLVDGVGIYPGQDKELAIDDIYRQYEECARYIRMIPESISIIICAGNHDAMRISEPQPRLYSDIAKPFWDIKNVLLVTNPSVVNIHSSGSFSGFDVLMYHGYSFDYYIANVDSIRNGGGYDRADLMMKFLLQRRHLAPSHSSTLYVPSPGKDSLVIDKVPDFFVTGHIHKTAVANHKGITLISGSCWQSKTAFQEKVGHHPEPCRVPIVNLMTRDVKILKFG